MTSMGILVCSPHQGFILKARPVEFVEVDGLEEPGSVGDHWLALDEVWDPQNFGALLRSAYFLGMKASHIICLIYPS